MIVMGADKKGKKKMMRRGDGSSSEEEDDRVAGQESAAAAVLPEKAVLELILDTLQRRDIYDIFGEPVDPEKCTEEEDYYETIQGRREAMDFGTMRAKLHEGMYTSLEQFQYDVLLITRNAMRFNQPTTIIYKQGHVIDEQANKVFHLLLTSSNPDEFRKQLIRESRRRRSSSRIRRPLPTRRISASTPTNKRSSSSLPLHTSTHHPQYDTRSTYTRIGNDPQNPPTTNIQSLQLTVQQQQQQDEIIRYKESLTRFVKDLGPTAKKVAKMKLLPLSNMSGRTMTLSSTAPLAPIASHHHHSTPAAPLNHTFRSDFRRPVILALPCSTDITRKKAATNSNGHINPPGIISIRKNRPPPPPLQDKLHQHSSLNHNTSRINQTSTTMTVGDAAQQFIPPLIPLAPQFKFDLQFLQTKLHHMKSAHF